MKTKILTICSIALMIGFNLNYAKIGYGYNSSKLLKIAYAAVPPDSGSGSSDDTSSGDDFTSSNECCIYPFPNFNKCNITKHVMPDMAVCITSTEWILFNCDSTHRETIVSKTKPEEALSACYYHTQPHTEQIYGNIVECYPDGGPCNVCERVGNLCPPTE